MSTLTRTTVVGAVSLCLAVPTASIASAQDTEGYAQQSLTVQPLQEPEPEPPDTHCYPLSLFCGFDVQVGPFGPFDFDILPGGSVFPPAPSPPP